MSHLVVVVPVKDGRGAKQRLSGLLPQHLRTELAFMLLNQTLRDLARFAPDVDRLVISDSAAVAEVAAEHGAAFLREPEGAGETAAVERATEWTIARGYRAQAVIPADMAELAFDDVRRLIAAAPAAPAVVLCPAVGDDGTNAILASPPNAVRYRFGARSFDGYRAAAAEVGVACRILRLESFVLDIDTPEDVYAFIERCPKNPVARWLSDQLQHAVS